MKSFAEVNKSKLNFLLTLQQLHRPELEGKDGKAGLSIRIWCTWCLKMNIRTWGDMVHRIFCTNYKRVSMVFIKISSALIVEMIVGFRF